jgi:hypothetical protein
MKWPRWYPSRADKVGVLIAIVLLSAVAAAAILGPQQRTNFGFGPDWDCKAVPKGEPVCIKKLAQ